MYVTSCCVGRPTKLFKLLTNITFDGSRTGCQLALLVLEVLCIHDY